MENDSKNGGFAFPATVIILGIALLSLAAVPPLIKIAREQLQAKFSTAPQVKREVVSSSETMDSAHGGIKLRNPAVVGCKNDIGGRDATIEDKGNKWLFANKFFRFEFPKDLYLVGTPPFAESRLIDRSAGLAVCNDQIEGWGFSSIGFFVREVLPEYPNYGGGGRSLTGDLPDYEYHATGRAAERHAMQYKLSKVEKLGGPNLGYRIEYQLNDYPRGSVRDKRIHIYMVTGNNQEGMVYTLDAYIDVEKYDEKINEVNKIFDSFKILRDT